MKEQTSKQKEQSKLGKSSERILIRNKRASVKQLRRAKRGLKRGLDVKKRLKRRKSKNRNL